ncbi:extracellular solute-binding protein [Lentibacillus salinarum]|uniref:Extracellular solute-binding protein n=1 Tax=Lentibacillus salinarum TaxID=446820 RepID=A0ABW3ZVL9_9BACI
MKKLFGALLFTFVFILGACSSDDAGGESDGGSSSDGEQSISVAMVKGAETKAISELVPQFEEETGIKVDLNEFNYDTLYERIYNDLRSEGGAYDVIFADDPWMPMFAGGDFLTPLDELDYTPDDDFAKMSRQVSMWPAPSGPRLPGSDPDEEPRYYGVPAVGNVQLFFYRKDILDEAPETWDDVVTAAEEHKDEIEYGFVPRGARGNAIASNFSAFLWSHGANFFDDEWNVTLDNPEAIEALELYVSLKEYAPDGVANYNADELGRVMGQGDGLMSVVWPVWGEEMEKEDSAVKGKIGYSLVPKAEGQEHAPMIGNWIMGIPQISENKDPALEFIKWASSEEVQVEMTRSGGLPTRKSVLTDSELNEDIPYLEAVADGLENANFRPRTPLYSEVESIYGTVLNQALTEDLTPEEALTQAADEIEKLMEDNGYYN